MTPGNSQEQIPNSEEKFYLLFQQAADAIMITDFNGNFLNVNESLCRMFGYSRTELLTMNIKSLIDPEELKVRPLSFERLLRGEHEFSQRRMMHRNGTIVEVEANVKKFSDDSVMAIARDVTELRHAEQLIQISEASFRGAFEFSAIGMAMISLQGNLLRVNKALCDIVGYTEQELLSLTFQQITYPDDLPANLMLMNKTLTGELESYQMEKRCFHKTGTIVWVHLAAAIIKDASGTPLYFIAQIENITERKKTEDEIIYTNAQLRLLTAYVQNAREEERKKIAREIHDELGQLLTGLKIDVSWIKNKMQNSTDEIHNRLTDVLQLTDQTINSVRRIATELRPGILDDLGLQAAIDWQAREFKQKAGIKCTVTGSLADANYNAVQSITAFRILQESLTNVIRHANAHNVIIRISEINETLSISIIDDGAGIPFPVHEKMHSLGIMGMQERAIIAGGNLFVQSVPGKGTTVTVKIPFAPATA